jgi:hypothetical protein
LDRFKAAADPLGTLDAYLREVALEASRRSYRFNVSKLGPATARRYLSVTNGQLAYESEHLRKKLAARDPARLSALPPLLEPHPLFIVKEGDIEPWEKVSPP